MMTHLTNNNLFITQSVNHMECALVVEVVIINSLLLHEL